MLWSSKPIRTARPGESELDQRFLGFRVLVYSGNSDVAEYGEVEDTSSALGFGAPTPGFLLLMASPSSWAFSFTLSFVAAPASAFVNHEGEVEEKTYEAPEKEAPKDEAKIQVGSEKKAWLLLRKQGSTMHVGAN